MKRLGDVSIDGQPTLKFFISDKIPRWHSECLLLFTVCTNDKDVHFFIVHYASRAISKELRTSIRRSE